MTAAAILEFDDLRGELQGITYFRKYTIRADDRSTLGP
jgi:hypothetical protein